MLCQLEQRGQVQDKENRGVFCKQHAHQFRESDRTAAEWESFQEPLALVAKRFEAEQMDMAMVLSVQENELSRPNSRGARAWQRLVPACLNERVETAGDWSCILFSAGLPVDVQDLL